MQVILLEKIKGLGALGAKVDVKPGFGRNFLIPQGKALPATARNLADFEVRRAELERQEAAVLAAAEARGAAAHRESVGVSVPSAAQLPAADGRMPLGVCGQELVTSLLGENEQLRAQLAGYEQLEGEHEALRRSFETLYEACLEIDGGGAAGVEPEGDADAEGESADRQVLADGKTRLGASKGTRAMKHLGGPGWQDPSGRTVARLK